MIKCILQKKGYIIYKLCILKSITRTILTIPTHQTKYQMHFLLIGQCVYFCNTKPHGVMCTVLLSELISSLPKHTKSSIEKATLILYIATGCVWHCIYIAAWNTWAIICRYIAWGWNSIKMWCVLIYLSSWLPSLLTFKVNSQIYSCWLLK